MAEKSKIYLRGLGAGPSQRSLLTFSYPQLHGIDGLAMLWRILSSGVTRVSAGRPAVCLDPQHAAGGSKLSRHAALRHAVRPIECAKLSMAPDKFNASGRASGRRQRET